MSSELHKLRKILGHLAMIRDNENELIGELTILIDSPDMPDVSEHTRRVFRLAKDTFGGGAAQFLIHRHWKLNNQAPIVVAQSEEGAHEVEMLLIRIINGICA